MSLPLLSCVRHSQLARLEAWFTNELEAVGFAHLLDADGADPPGAHSALRRRVLSWRIESRRL